MTPLFLLKNSICNFVNDNTIYSCDDDDDDDDDDDELLWYG